MEDILIKFAGIVMAFALIRGIKFIWKKLFGAKLDQ